MLLPVQRNTSYGAETPVRHQDLNDIQDCIIAGKKAPFWRWKPMSRGWVETNITFETTGGIGTGAAKANAPAAVIAGIAAPDLVAGDRIIAIAARFLGTGGAGTAHVYLERHPGDGSLATNGDLQIANPPAAWATYTLDLTDAPHTVADPEAFFFACSMPLTNMALASVAIQIDRL